MTFPESTSHSYTGRNELTPIAQQAVDAVKKRNLALYEKHPKMRRWIDAADYKEAVYAVQRALEIIAE